MEPVPAAPLTAARSVKALLALEGRAVAGRHHGTVVVVIAGRGPVTLRLEAGRIRVSRDLPERAELWVGCREQTLERLFAHETPAAELLQSGDLRISGDGALFSVLGQACESPKSALGVRLAAGI